MVSRNLLFDFFDFSVRVVKVFPLMLNCFSLQQNGFFIEAGALNGEKGSNSLSLETDLGWSGLLAEGDPSNVELVKYA